MATAKSPLPNSSREKLQQAYNLAGEAASETVGQLKARAMSSVQSNKQRASDIADKAESSIKEHPILSVSGAFVVGWVIAKLLK